MIYQNILECIGHTPVIALQRMAPTHGARVLVKYEGLNVGGSIKHARPGTCCATPNGRA